MSIKHHPATKLCIVDLWGSINLHLEALKDEGNWSGITWDQPPVATVRSTILSPSPKGGKSNLNTGGASGAPRAPLPWPHRARALTINGFICISLQRDCILVQRAGPGSRDKRGTCPQADWGKTRHTCRPCGAQRAKRRLGAALPRHTMHWNMYERPS